MGRPVKKTLFGLGTAGSNQLVIDGVKFADGSVATNAYVVKQTGSAAYIVQDAAMSHAPEIVFMVNAGATATLLPGQCYTMAKLVTGVRLPCSKISQFRVDIFNTTNTVPTVTGGNIAADGNGITSYSWSKVPAVTNDQANLNLS